MTDTATPLAVHMVGIGKRFGAVQANRAVDLRVQAGTVHGIVGENGAGKSTLMSILYGFYQADEGQIQIDGQPVRIRDSREAMALGIGMVHQHFMLVDSMTALDNVLLGAEPDWRLGAAREALTARLNTLMAQTGLSVRLDVMVEDLPVGERQRLEILKALVRGARVLILDEPTAVLTPEETSALFDALRGLRERGTTVLLITHKLKEILALCDRVTVMRGGEVVLEREIAQTSVDDLAHAMVGRRVATGRRTPSSEEQGPAAAVRPTLLQAQGLRWTDAFGVARLDDVSLELKAGEIVGVAGVTGNGQTELLEVLSGLKVPQSGTLVLAGDAFVASAWLSPAQARQRRLAHVPEDRLHRALILPFAAWESAVLGYQGWRRYGRWAWMNRRAMREATLDMMQAYDVRPRNPELRSSKFSGGNQQKLVLAREAQAQPSVLLVGQPTRGVDIGAIEFIHARLRAHRDAGGAVLVVSSELDEILAISDRVLVMNAGRVAGELPIEDCHEAALGRLMGGAVH
ncbi:MAG: ABC transporter ATP-binding protein [Betaproteobacteria bacterium]